MRMAELLLHGWPPKDRRRSHVRSVASASARWTRLACPLSWPWLGCAPQYTLPRGGATCYVDSTRLVCCFCSGHVMLISCSRHPNSQVQVLLLTVLPESTRALFLDGNVESCRLLQERGVTLLWSLQLT